MRCNKNNSRNNNKNHEEMKKERSLTRSQVRIGCFGLDMFNAVLSMNRYWRGPGSLEVERRGRLYLTLHRHHRNESASRWAAVEAVGMFHLL